MTTNAISNQWPTSASASHGPAISVVEPLTSSWCAWWEVAISNGDLRSAIISRTPSVRPSVGSASAGGSAAAMAATENEPATVPYATAASSISGSATHQQDDLARDAELGERRLDRSRREDEEDAGHAEDEHRDDEVPAGEQQCHGTRGHHHLGREQARSQPVCRVAALREQLGQVVEGLEQRWADAQLDRCGDLAVDAQEQSDPER